MPDDKWLAAQSHLDYQYRNSLAKLKRIEGDIQRYQQALPLTAQRAHDYKELAFGAVAVAGDHRADGQGCCRPVIGFRIVLSSYLDPEMPEWKEGGIFNVRHFKYLSTSVSI